MVGIEFGGNARGYVIEEFALNPMEFRNGVKGKYQLTVNA